MKHVRTISTQLPMSAQAKGDTVRKECTPLKEKLFICEDL
jgi:hypothetical protein